MSYESGTNGLGVGQRYGEREVGNVQGKVGGVSATQSLVFEFDGTDAAALAAQSFSIPEGYGIITTVYVDVDAVFASGTVDVDVDGSPINTAPTSLTALGMVDVAIGASEPIDSTSVVTVSNPTAAVAAAAGSYCKVVVEFARV